MPRSVLPVHMLATRKRGHAERAICWLTHFNINTFAIPRLSLLHIIWVRVLAQRQECPGKALPELSMAEGGPLGVELHNSLEHIDLPQAKPLCEMPFRPAHRPPDVGHAHNALPQLVVQVHHVHPLAVQLVHLWLVGLQAAVLNRAIGAVHLPSLRMHTTWQHGLGRRDQQERHLLVVASSDECNLPSAAHVKGTRESYLLATPCTACLTTGFTVALDLFDLCKQLRLGVVLVSRLHVHHAEDVVLEQRDGARNGAKP